MCDGVFAPSLEGDARSLLKGSGVCRFRRLSVAFAPAVPVADGVELCIGTGGQNSPFLQLHCSLDWHVGVSMDVDSAI